MQLRQMAVLDSHKGKGVGAQLVAYAEAFAQQKGYTVIETRARKQVEGFYHKLGYQSYEDEFSDAHTLLMRKAL